MDRRKRTATHQGRGASNADGHAGDAKHGEPRVHERASLRIPRCGKDGSGSWCVISGGAKSRTVERQLGIPEKTSVGTGCSVSDPNYDGN